MAAAIHALKKKRGSLVWAKCGRVAVGLLWTTVDSLVTCPNCVARRDGRQRPTLPPGAPNLKLVEG